MSAAATDPSSGPESRTGDIGVMDAYKRGWETLKSHFGILLGSLIIALLLNMVPSVLNMGMGAGATTPPDPSQLGTMMAVSWGYGLLIAGPLSYGLFYLYLRAARDQDPGLGDLFEGFRHYLSTLGAVLLVGILTMIGFVLLIIPGIIAAIRLSFVPFLVTDEDMGAIDALKESWSRTKGHGWSLFGLFLLAFPVALVGVLLLIIGIIPAMMLIYAAFAAYFDGVTGRPTTTPGPGPAPEETSASPA